MTFFETLENPTRKKIILEFFQSQKIINYKYIKQLVENDTSRPDYHLNLLIENNLIKRTKGRGNYIIDNTNVQPLRKKLIDENLLEKVPICLIGGLGVEVELYSDLLKALNEISIIPKKYYLLTTEKCKEKLYEEKPNELTQIETIIKADKNENFKQHFREDFYWSLNKFEEIIINEIYNYEIICELTGSTKLISGALSKLADKYNLEKIYFSSKKIIWL